MVVWINYLRNAGDSPGVFFGQGFANTEFLSIFDTDENIDYNKLVVGN